MRDTATIDAELRALAADALESERRDLITQLHGIAASVESYKADAAEAARYRLPVPYTTTLADAITSAVGALMDLHLNSGEWSR